MQCISVRRSPFNIFVALSGNKSCGMYQPVSFEKGVWNVGNVVIWKGKIITPDRVP